MKIGQYLKESTFISAYWLTPKGQIIDCGARTHIDYIVKSPGKFGLKEDDLRAIYDRYGEPYGFEGKAREEIIVKALEKGFIRLRKYKDVWSATVWDYNRKTAKMLSNWAYGMLSGEYGTVEKDKWAEVKINQMHAGTPPKNIDITGLSGLAESHKLLALVVLDETIELM